MPLTPALAGMRMPPSPRRSPRRPQTSPPGQLRPEACVRAVSEEDAQASPRRLPLASTSPATSRRLARNFGPDGQLMAARLSYALDGLHGFPRRALEQMETTLAMSPQRRAQRA